MDKVVELSLKNSELRYRRLFEAAQDGILILDAVTGAITDVNPYLINMLGYSHDEFVGKKLWDVGAFRDTKASQEAFETLQKIENIRYDNLPLKGKDGSLIQVEFVSNVYMVGDEKVIQCNIRDITERKRLSTSLHENEKKYSDLVNQSSDAVFIVELSGRFLAVNKAMSTQLGFTQEEFLTMNIWDIVPEQYRDQHRNRIKEILEGKSLGIPAEYALHGKDGKTYYVEISSAPYYKGKDIIGFQGIGRNITERKKADEALQSSKQFIEGIINAIPVRVYWKNKNSVFLGCNEAFAHDAGFSDSKDIIGKDDYQMVWRDRAELYRNDDRQVIERGILKLDIEEPLTTANGDTIAVLATKVPLRSPTGEIIGLIGTYLDISERKHMEEVLERERRDYQTIIDTAPVMVAYKSKDDHFVKVNSAFADFVGLPAEEIIGKTTFELVKQQDVAQLGRESDLEVIRSGKPILNKLVRWSGFFSQKEIWATFSKLPFHDSDGNITGTVSFVNDVDDRVRAEEALRESEERFRALIENNVDAITLIDAQGVTIYDSPAAPGMLGYGPNDLIGRNAFSLIHPDDAARIQDLYQNLTLTPGLRVECTFRVQHRSGSWIWLDMIATNLLAESAVKAIVLNYRDITGRKLDEEKIQRQLNHLTALSYIDRVITANFDIKLTLSEILIHVTKELGVDAGDILLFDPKLNVLEFCVDRGFRSAAVKKTQLLLGDSYAGRAALERRLIHIPDLRIEKDTRLLSEITTADDFVCYFGVPLINKGHIKGVLEVFHRSSLEPDPEWYDFLYALAGQAAIAIENASLYENLQRSNLDLALAYDATIEGWSHALDLRDKETEGHTQRVTELTVKLARAFGLNDAELKQVRWGALLHDIGKMGVPDGILLKPGPLSDEEWVAMKKHPTFAYEMLSPIHYLNEALDIPYYHHEKWDGTGYPLGLKGTQIPLVARIFALVDVWDALGSDRPYRAAWTEEKVREFILASSGTHFDPKVVDIFMQLPH